MEMTARGTDWGLAGLVAALLVTGGLTLFAGDPSDAWVFALHDALGLSIVLLLIVKLHRVWPRIAVPARWHRRTVAGAAGTGVVIAAVGSGLMWTAGLTPQVADYNLLSWHDALGVVLALVVVVHMALRAKPIRRRDVANRRQFLLAAGMAVGSAVAWRAQRPLQQALGLRGARRRFTGSYQAGSFAGNGFPSTSWVADHPRPVPLGSYRLVVGGLADHQRALTIRDLGGTDELIATLDCTGGFYSTQRWRGVMLGRVLDQAGIPPRARHVRVVSRTGYRWGFALEDARHLLLATHVGDQPLSHDHGAPVRLVVPRARGFQWVKWVERVELLEHPDYGAVASTVWSSFTDVGRGAA
jgi:DMSO/TMAO reductase YedYZ molybdopterin-dependent catalytic subunit